MTKREATYQILSSLMAFFVSLWVGSYITHTFWGTWASFPAFMTTILVCVLCVIWFAGAVTKYQEKE